jgi:ribonuclease HI
MTAPEAIVAYTDGGCDPNPGPGGWAAVLVFGAHRKEIFGAFRKTTNNRMEIFAAISALDQVKKPVPIVLWSDSQYLVDAIEKGWARRWRANGWRRNPKEKAQNSDLWEVLLTLTERLVVQFRWVRGHAGVPENERCDELVARARIQGPLLPDSGYESR